MVYGEDVALGDDPRGIQRVFFAALGQKDAEELAEDPPPSTLEALAAAAAAAAAATVAEDMAA